MPKKALRGLSGIQVFELLENTETNYKVGDAISIPYAQKLSRDIQTSSDNIYADDDVYDDEEIFEGENFDLEIPEADLKLMSIIEGGTYDEDSKEYSWGPDDKGKEYAMTFKAKRKDGKYRMFRYYRCKFKKVKQDLQTQDNGTQISVLTISGTFYRRALLSDPKVRTYKDSETISDLEWLNTIPSIEPVIEEEIVVNENNLEELIVTSSESEETVGNTIITVAPTLTAGNSYKYKTATNVELPEYDDICTTGYTDWNGTEEITATNGNEILIVEVDENNKAKKAGTATIVAKVEGE